MSQLRLARELDVAESEVRRMFVLLSPSPAVRPRFLLMSATANPHPG